MYFFYYYPVGVDQPRSRRPLVTAALLGLMLIAFVWLRYFPDLLGYRPTRLIFLPGSGEPWTALSAILLHASWLHLLGNALYLAVLGPLLEDRLGRRRFLLYFLMFGAAGNIAHGLCAVAGWVGGLAGVMGGSGAIAGLLAFALVRFYYARIAMAYWVFSPLQGINRAGRSSLPMVAAVILWLVLQGISALVARQSGTQIAYAAHFGGFGLGLFMALALGHHREGQAGLRLSRARRHLERGEPYAAEGDLLEYLQIHPDDREALRQLARARRMAGRVGDGRQSYRQAYQLALAAGQGDEALEIYREARRGDAAMVLPADELAQAAFLLEKQLDFRGAAEAHLDLYRYHRQDRRAEHAIVRAIVLLRSKLVDDASARRWLEVALHEFPHGTWRAFLEREFAPIKPGTDRRATGRAASAASPPAPAA